MKIETSEVREGSHNGETVWICHYLRPDLAKKALRNLPPTEVIVRCNSELPKNKRVYYSISHFSPIGKSGQPLSKVISPVDNTGYRMISGNELFVFSTKAECIEEWNNQVGEACAEIAKCELTAAKSWRDQREDLENMML
jgi:hypothetical protein